MTVATHTWLSYKAFIDERVAANASLLYRGQSNESWGLISSYHRLVAPGPPSVYWKVLTTVHDYVSTWTAQRWNLDDKIELASFLGFLQHNGFPTPLLDWTRSPYTAAYFAFAEVNDESPASDNVALFAFDANAWASHWTPVYDVQNESPHVSILQSESRGNRKQLIQQGLYTFSTVRDQEQHIRSHATSWLATHRVDPNYLIKATISVHEKPLAMRDLALMGISPLSLFPGVEGVCQHLKNVLFPVPNVGATPSERNAALLAALKSVSQQVQPVLQALPTYYESPSTGQAQ